MFKTIEAAEEFLGLHTPFVVSSAKNGKKFAPVFITTNAKVKTIKHLAEKLTEQTPKELKEFFMWFRLNGEKYINLSIEQMIQIYLKTKTN